MLPLYAAMAHGCQAGRYREALEDIYCKSICRKEAFFSLETLGAYGADLAVLARFFTRTWVDLRAEVPENMRGFVLNQAAQCLMSLGRLAEAVQPTQASLQDAIARENWSNSTFAYNNLCLISLDLGNLAQAEEYARQSYNLSDQYTDKSLKIGVLAGLSLVFTKQGQLILAQKLFRQAEKMQHEWDPKFPFLLPLGGYEYCELQLNLGRYGEVIERALNLLKYAKGIRFIRDIGLGYLNLGEAYLGEALMEGRSDLSSSLTHFDDAVATFRQGGGEGYVVDSRWKSAWWRAISLLLARAMAS